MDPDPERAARHVAYELGMFRTVYASFPVAGPLDAARLESFLIHTRNLIEFLFDGGPQRAVLPKDFGGCAVRDKSGEMRALRDEISQLVSNLTWDRVTVHEPKVQDWSHARLSRINDLMRKKASEVFGSIPAECHGWFASDAFPNELQHWLG